MKSKNLSFAVAALSMFSILLSGCGGTSKKANRVDRSAYTNDYYLVTTKGEGRKAMPYTTVEYFIENEKTGEAEYKSYHQVKDVRVLVVPVDFTDYPAESRPNGAEGAREDIRKLHFGEASETAWNSLSSYYRSTSFGQANITGKVAEWYHTGMSVTEFARYGEGGTDATQKLAKDIQDYYSKGGEGFGKINLADFDSNKDGYVDATIIIYSCPEKVRVGNKAVDDDLYWAFATVRNGAFGRLGAEAIYNYFWTSINTFYEAGHVNEQGQWVAWTDEEIKNGTAKTDAHVLTHEFGHILGLPDYYSYDANKGEDDYGPMGGVDMMDYNIGDHNAMSKAWYGWTEPYVVTSSCEITINSSTLTGDSILIPVGGNYKNTLIDQFICIELLTPDGVAKYDGINKYHGSGSNDYPYFYNEIGIRVMHADARMGLFTHNSTLNKYVFSSYTSSYTDINNAYVGFAHDNTKSRSAFPNYRFLELLPSDGIALKDRKYSGLSSTADNSFLFQEGQTFGGSSKTAVYPNYMMNGVGGDKDTALGFSFTIKKIDKENKTATISFKKL